METSFLVLIATATVVTTIINFVKPLYDSFVSKKVAKAISILLSLILGVVGAFSVKGYISFELTYGALVLIGLAIGTGAGVFYDLWKLVQVKGSTELPKLDS